MDQGKLEAGVPRSFSYVDSYNGDIRFDNIYISTYFRQIDERRKKLGRRSLLPLCKAEKKTVIFPYNPTIQATEMKNVVRELMETLPILLLFLVLCGLDWALYSIFDTIRHHSFLEYSFRSEPCPPRHPRRAPTPVQPSHPNSSNSVISSWFSAPPCPPRGQISALQPNSCSYLPQEGRKVPLRNISMP